MTRFVKTAGLVVAVLVLASAPAASDVAEPATDSRFAAAEHQLAAVRVLSSRTKMAAAGGTIASIVANAVGDSVTATHAPELKVPTEQRMARITGAETAALAAAVRLGSQRILAGLDPAI